MAVAGWPPDGAGVSLEDLPAWSKAKLGRELAGEPDAHVLSTERVTPPLGRAIRYTPWLRNAQGKFHLVLYHIWTPRGVVHFSTGAQTTSSLLDHGRRLHGVHVCLITAASPPRSADRTRGRLRPRKGASTGRRRRPR